MSEKVSFFKRKNIEISVQRYLIDALGSMALGLFCSLLIGTILKTIGDLTGLKVLLNINAIAGLMTGPAIAVAAAWALKAPPLVLFSTCVVGAIGYGLSVTGTSTLTAVDVAGAMTPIKDLAAAGITTLGTDGVVKATGKIVVGGFTGGGPVGAFVAACVATEFGKMVSKETKVDIIVTPAVTILVGTLVGIYVGPPVSAFMTWFGNIVNFATQQQPIVMGILVSALMGIALTLPISSAAIAAALGLSGVAAGASTVGCATQMVGFAVMSFRENGWGGLVAQGLGTSMLQVPNIIKNWKIWIPPTLASMILGPLATTIFKMDNISIGAGMGTSGLVGQIGTITKMSANPENNATMMYIGIALLHFILPAILTWAIAKYLRKINWIKENDLKLDL